MKDRQPTQVLANGAIRYGVYNADGSLNHYEYLKREDAPTVEGTPLNKANLLSDATAAKLWPNADTRPEDPTVSEALTELRKGKTKIGDVLITARAKPSDAWLLCNGQSIERSNYPQLFELLRSAASPVAWTNKTVTGVDRATKAVCYANSKWFAFTYDSEPPYPMQMYVSEDGITWEHHLYTLTSSYSAGKTAMYYDAEEDVYYIATSGYVNSSYMLSSDFSTITELKDFAGASSQPVYALQLHKTTDGQLCWVMWRKPKSSGDDIEVILYTLNKSTQEWSQVTIDTGITAIDYDSALNRFYYVKRTYSSGYIASVYFVVGLSGEKTMVGSFSPSNGSILIPFIDLSSNTIVVMFSSYTDSVWKLRYAYSTNRGETWSEGSETVATQVDSHAVPSVDVSYGYQYVNGLLICTIVGENGAKYICSLSDPSDKAYKVIGTFNGALSPSGLAIMPPTTETVAVCNYADAARPIPKIIPDTRSHAYIKALEE
mgnify:CR=1 FL=1